VVEPVLPDLVDKVSDKVFWVILPEWVFQASVYCVDTNSEGGWERSKGSWHKHSSSMKAAAHISPIAWKSEATASLIDMMGDCDFAIEKCSGN
jgi:hypothetical protein